jgi:hypothetical protein
VTTDPDEPKTIADVRAGMFAAVREFRTRAAGANQADRERYVADTRRAIERLRKQFRHRIDDQLRRDARRHRGLSEGERLGLERLLRMAAEGSLAALVAAAAEAAIESRAGSPSSRP